MELTNPKPIAILANIKNAEGNLEWFEIPPGEVITVDDPVVASTLVEYGAKSNPVDVAAAREAHAAVNREINSKAASASASEGQILVRQQATVSVEAGAVDGGPLKGAELTAAVKAANEAGAEIKSTLSADEKRDALAAWQRTTAGVSSRVNADEFVTDEDGELVLDEDGNPIPVQAQAGPEATVEYDADGNPVTPKVDGDGDSVLGDTDGDGQADGKSEGDKS
jgi:hypothetical protein